MRRVEVPLLRIVMCYHNNDIDHVRLLEAHLAPLSRAISVEIWHRGMVPPGDSTEALLQEKLRTSHIVLLMVSADFNANWDASITASLRASPLTTLRVVPIPLRPCTWNGLPFYGMQPIPPDGLPLVREGRQSKSDSMSPPT